MMTTSTAMPINPPVVALLRQRAARIIRACRWLAVALAAGALLGCSLIGLGYNRLPLMAYWWLDKQVDLTAAQSDRIRPQLQQWLAWHRQQELPQLLQTLQRWQHMAAGEVSAAQACAELDLLQNRFNAAVERSLPALALLATDMKPQQWEHLQRQNAKTNDEFRSDYLDDPKAARKKRLERATDWHEKLYGRLNPAQRNALERLLDASPFNPEATLAERQRRQTDVLAALQRMALNGKAETEVQGLWQRFNDSPTPGYNANTAARKQAICDQVAQIHHLATAEQRQRAVLELAGYEKDLRSALAP
jgi:hypothetical protein